VIATSGSTGNPAGVLLPAGALRAAARGFAAHSGRPDGHSWVAALPLHHAGGFMVAVRAAVAGTAVVPVASLGGAEPFTVQAFEHATEQAVALASRDGTPLAVSLVPAMLATLDAAGSEGVALLRSYDAVLVGGAAAPGRLVARLRQAGVRLRRSYGMTETCGGVVLDGRPLPGAVLDTTADGRLRVRGEQVALGYRDGREAARWSVTPDGSRGFVTGDLGSVAADGEVHVLGRVDDVVQVGGASVALGAVARVLRDDARVAEAEVVAVPDERLGSRLVGLVVAAAGSPTGALATSLAECVAAELGRAARPRHVELVATLPMLASGKPDRAALLELAAAALRG
jgi:O-succinylbenzoic acid--CoA ligase